MFCLDKPINKANDDILHRNKFSKQLAQAILSYTVKDNFTIGLCGKWGSGKTSILNMVEEHIQNQTKDYEEAKKPIIIHFNPWNYSDRSQLTVQFFQTILTELKCSSNNKALKQAGEALQRYSSILEYAEMIPVAGKYFKPLKSLFSGFGKGLSDFSDSQNNLEQQKNEVIKALGSQSQKLIVIIDDIDRLNNEQIRLIFQLVNSLAGFPNMIYLLSFDREVVTRALSDEQKCNGEEYLEKIIQMPFDIPEVQISLVHEFLFNKLENLLFNEIPCDNFEKEYWDSVFQNCISPFIKGIRDVNRIMNVYRFKYALMHDETNCIDLLALTTLQICAPSIFEWIYHNEERVTGSQYDYGMTSIDQNKTKSELLEEFKIVYAANPELMLQTIQALFPKISWISGGYFYNDDTQDKLRKKQKIACPSRFSFYFDLSLDDITFTKKQILDSINNYNFDKLKVSFAKWTSEDKLYKYTQELFPYIEDIPKERLNLFLLLLLDAQTNAMNYEQKGIFEPIPASLCEKCCWRIFEKLDKEQTEKEIIKIIKTSEIDLFSIIMGMIYKIEVSYGRIGNLTDSYYQVVEESQLENIEQALKRKLASVSKKYNLLEAFSFINIYYIWKYIDSDALEEYLKKALIIPSNVPKYLEIQAGIWQGSNENGWNFKEENFSEYISVDKAYQKIVSLKNTVEFSELKFEIKEIAVAFYLWYNNRDYHNITRQKVDALIPQWEKQEELCTN